jgi:hypothetical protein
MSEAEPAHQKFLRALPTPCSTHCRCPSLLDLTAASPTPRRCGKLLRSLGAVAAPADAARSAPFGSPLLALSNKAPSRRRGERIQGRSVDPCATPAIGWSICTSPAPERPDHVVVMLQERTTPTRWIANSPTGARRAR